ncbi:LytR family transcriptional regulator [Actinomadura soli]|uniref:LytR family transcriptional regulator n=2 Tax=Actinomadura soli TaxID=2508997 RepID=A0A5C4JBL9_9ACTN|nr:LytR family transcriptional regulator [Actinomadura soli]
MRAAAQVGTKSLTTDKGLDLAAVVKIAHGLRDLTADGLGFVTVPVTPYPPDLNRVTLQQPSAGRFFTTIREDKTLKAEGFRIVAIGTAKPRRNTLILYGDGAERQAATLATVIPKTEPTPHAKPDPGVVALVVGADFTSAKTSTPPAPDLPKAVPAGKTGLRAELASARGHGRPDRPPVVTERFD